jgi:8-oxo-dGTP pyrophosphatase MutT (NUDIX family)
VSVVEDPAPERWQVTVSKALLKVWLLTVRQDGVVTPSGKELTRIAVTHPGAVVILALDDSERVLMIKQYRHPAGRELWEVPAGLRDVAQESLLAAAERELREETFYQARRWDTLVDYYTSPGFSDERIRIFLARDLVPPSADELARQEAERAEKLKNAEDDEETYIVTAWVPLAEAVELALAGRLHNGPAVTAVLAGAAALSRGFAGLRPADALEDDAPEDEERLRK